MISLSLSLVQTHGAKLCGRGIFSQMQRHTANQFLSPRQAWV